MWVCVCEGVRQILYTAYTALLIYAELCRRFKKKILIIDAVVTNTNKKMNITAQKRARLFKMQN